MKSVEDNTIVGVGDDPEGALREAEEKGFKNPVLLYIPEKDLVHIYPVVDNPLLNRI
jgi:hypothetical protein